MEQYSCDTCQVIDPALHNVNYSNGSTIIWPVISLFLKELVYDLRRRRCHLSQIKTERYKKTFVNRLIFRI